VKPRKRRGFENSSSRRTERVIFDAWVSDIKKGPNCCTSRGRAAASRRGCGKICRSGFAVWKSPSARSPIFQRPEAGGRWGQGLTAAKMEECRWIEPVLVGQVEFTEWTPDNHLRHSRFVALRDDKRPMEVRREWPWLPPNTLPLRPKCTRRSRIPGPWLIRIFARRPSAGPAHTGCRGA
jgi:hypothetical protein